MDRLEWNLEKCTFPTGIYKTGNLNSLCSLMHVQYIYVDVCVCVCVCVFHQISHAAVSALCRSIKLQCELYSSRQIAICLDPYCGLGFVLWCLCR